MDPSVDAPTGNTESLHDRIFRGRTLRGSQFIACDLGDVVVRGSDVAGMELDSPWLLEGDNTLLVNGVDVVPLVDAELNLRFPGRESRRAKTPEGLRDAWAAVEAAWAALVGRASIMPVEFRDVSVHGEWSLVQTLRHLVMATDTWLGKAILGLESPYHPLGLPDSSVAHDPTVFTDDDPAWDQVLEARASRQGQVRVFLAEVSDVQLAESRPNPHDPQYSETLLACLATILEEEWEHLRYATRDLGLLAGGAPRR